MVEGLATLEALEGLLPGVDDVVVNEGCALSEGFPTVAALVGLLPSVGLLVPHEV